MIEVYPGLLVRTPSAGSALRWARALIASGQARV
jgi:hypothetical protein